jgi:hypothetical protein
MPKGGRRRWLFLALVGLVLIFASLNLGVGRLLPWLTPPVQAIASPAHGQASKGDSIKCTSGQRGPAFGGTVVVNPGEVVCSDLTAFGSTVDVEGTVQGAILAFGSSIYIAGSVSGDINLYGSRLVMQGGSHVHGDINLFGGNEQKKTGAQFDGHITDRASQPYQWLGANHEFVFPFWPMLTWALLGLLLTSLLPEHVMFVRTTVATKTRRSLVIGLLSLLLTPIVLLVLIALIIPIPFAIIVVIGLIAAWALGTVSIGWLVGEAVLRAVAPRQSTRLTQVVIGMAVLALLGALPYIGGLITLGVGVLGVGAVFLSRFGTRLYKPPRQPLTL